MKRKFHVRFCTGGGAGDCPTDRSAADRLHAPRTVVLGWGIAVHGLARLTCDRRRLNRVPLDASFAGLQQTGKGECFGWLVECE